MLRAADIPNAICILRILLVAPTVLALLGGRYPLALTLVCIAGFSDALDGYLAKRFDWRSRLGGLLDPLADKLLLVTSYVMLSIPNLRVGLVIPAWVTALVITRDVVIVGVALVLHLAVGISRFPPSPLSKVNTAAQLSAIIAVLLSSRGPLFEAGATFFVYLVAALTIGSGIEYIYRANRMAAHRE